MNLEDEKSWSFFMPQVKLSLLAGILLQQPPSAGRVPERSEGGWVHPSLLGTNEAKITRLPWSGALERSEAEGSYPLCPSEMTPIPINTPAPSGRPPSRHPKSEFPNPFSPKAPLPTIKNL